LTFIIVKMHAKCSFLRSWAWNIKVLVLFILICEFRNIKMHTNLVIVDFFVFEVN